MSDPGDQQHAAVPGMVASRREIPDSVGWDVFSIVLIFLGFLVQALQWDMSPKFVDMYYHLSAARGFSQAGGYVTTAFWEYAPVGRPHLTAPVFHVILLGFSKLGLSWIAAGRLAEAALFPCFLLTLWWIARKAISSCAAFFVLLAAFPAYSLYLSVVIHGPFTLAAMFTLGAFLAVERGRTAGGAVLLALALYSHLLMGAMGFAAVVLYGALRPGARKRAGIAALGALALAAPFLAYVFRERGYYTLVSVRENRLLEINPAVYCLAVAGLAMAVRKRGSLLFPVCLLAAMLPFCATHRARFLGGHGMIPLLLLAGVAMAELHGIVTRGGARKRAGAPFAAVAALFFLVAAPVLHVRPLEGAARLRWFDGTLTHYLLPERERAWRAKEHNVFPEAELDKLVELVMRNTGADDIIWCDYPYGGGAIGVMSGRSTSSAMMLEVRPFAMQDPVQAARLSIWIKSASEDIPAVMLPVAEHYGLQKLAETDMAYLWINPAGGLKSAAPPAPAVANPFLAGIAAAAFIIVAADCLRRRKRGRGKRAEGRDQRSEVRGRRAEVRGSAGPGACSCEAS